MSERLTSLVVGSGRTEFAIDDGWSFRSAATRLDITFLVFSER